MLYRGRKAIRRVPGKVIKAMSLPTPKVIQGFGARQQVGQICVDAGCKSVLVVTDKTLSSLGLHNKVLASLRECSIPFAVFDDIDSEPTIKAIESGRRAAIDCDADGIVAIGGGSVLDTGKMIAASARHPTWPMRHYLQKFAVVGGKSLLMINVPSNAGTGAERTVGAVVGNSRGTKSPTVIVGLHVPYVILDSELVVNAPKELTAWSAIDALSHGLEGLMADVDTPLHIQ
jgi:alcohol dehydrogenase class IV